jgi:hypothetical protein
MVGRLVKQLCCNLTPHSPTLAGLHTPEHLHVSSGYYASPPNASNVNENITDPALCLGRVSIKILTEFHVQTPPAHIKDPPTKASPVYTKKRTQDRTKHNLAEEWARSETTIGT